MDDYEVRGSLLSFGSKPANRDSGFFHWLSTVRLSRIILSILIVLVIVPIITHIYLSKVTSEQTETFLSRNKLDLPDDLSSAKASELKIRIEEMLRIKISVNNELRDLEAKRQKLNQEISNLGMKIEELKNEASHKTQELERIKLSISQAEVAHKEILERNQPELGLPAKLSISLIRDILPLPIPNEANQCSIYSCIDFSRCSIVGNFPVFVYPLGIDVFEREKASLMQTFNYNPHITYNPDEACLFIYVNGSPEKKIEDDLGKLSHWGGDGRNHIIFNIVSTADNISPVILSRESNEKANSVYGRAMLVQSVFHVYRPHFDLCVPPLLGPPGSDVWFDLPLLSPARRRYLLSFSGQQTSNSSSLVQSTLELLQTSTTSDEFYFEFQCLNKNDQNLVDSSLCGSVKTRAAILQQSTFALIPLPATGLTTLAVQLRLYEALKFGAIPVVIGNLLLLL